MTAPNGPGRGKVAVVETWPETVLADVRRAMELAGYRKALPRDNDTVLAIEMSTRTWYPTVSTNPWQLEGVIRTLQPNGYDRLVAIAEGPTGHDASVGTKNHKLGYVIGKYGLPSVHLDAPHIERVRYAPTKPFLVLDRLVPDGVTIPKVLAGRNVVHLPTVRPHALTAIAGAMLNARGGLLNDRRQQTLAAINETVVDLLQIQQDIHPGLLAVMDGTLAAEGAGSRERNLVLVSADQVAIDSVSASLQGFDPSDLPFIRIAHEKGLGVGDPSEIEIVGHDCTLAGWLSLMRDTTLAKRQRPGDGGLLAGFEKRLLASPAAALTVSAADLCRSAYWNPRDGRKRVKQALNTEWGQLFASYGDGRVAMPGAGPVPAALAALGAAGLLAGIVFGAKAIRKG